MQQSYPMIGNKSRMYDKTYKNYEKQGEFYSYEGPGIHGL